MLSDDILFRRRAVLFFLTGVLSRSICTYTHRQYSQENDCTHSTQPLAKSIATKAQRSALIACPGRSSASFSHVD